MAQRVARFEKVNLILIRHAHANWTDRKWDDDWERPLTDLGRKQSEVIGRALRRMFDSVDQLLTTPLVRARETAEIVGRAAGWQEPKIHDLADDEGRPVTKGTWAAALLGSFRDVTSGTLAYVGHDPTLSKFITLLLTGEEEPRKVEMDRAAAALVSFEGPPAAGEGFLRWLLVPRLLGIGA